MNARSFHRLLATAGLVSMLAACGGGDSAPAPVVAPDLGPARTAFGNDFARGLAALGTYEGLTSTAFIDLFDEAFLDAGYTKGQLRSNLAQDAVAMATAPELSGFPKGIVSAVTIADCDAASICSVTATFSNADADATAVTVTSRLKLIDGKYRLFGDQSSS